MRSALESEPLVLLAFSSSDCGTAACRELADSFEEAATPLSEKGIRLAILDCSKEMEVCNAARITEFPILRTVMYGNFASYFGPIRPAAEVVNYMVKQLEPIVVEITTANHLEFQTSDSLIIAVAYVSSTTEAAALVFNAVAALYREPFSFGMTTEVDAVNAAGVTPPAIVAYRKFDHPKTLYPYRLSSVSKQDLSEWPKTLYTPFFGEITRENFYIHEAKAFKPRAYLFLDQFNQSQMAQVAELMPLVERYKSIIDFVWMGGIIYAPYAWRLDLLETKLPAFVIDDRDSKLHYPYDQSKEVTTDGVYDWTEHFFVVTIRIRTPMALRSQCQGSCGLQRPVMSYILLGHRL